MNSVKIGDILKMEHKYSNHYDFYKIIKVSPKTIKAIKLQTGGNKIEDTGDFYGMYHYYCIDESIEKEDAGRYTKTIKIKDITNDMINNLTYDLKIYPD
jgi:hypothetical protein